MQEMEAVAVKDANQLLAWATWLESNVELKDMRKDSHSCVSIELPSRSWRFVRCRIAGVSQVTLVS